METFYNVFKKKIFLPSKSWKKHPQKLPRKTQIHFFFLTASSAQMAETEEIMFQNVAYRPTVYKTGALTVVSEWTSQENDPKFPNFQVNGKTHCHFAKININEKGTF